jgi:hypothetical protein
MIMETNQTTASSKIPATDRYLEKAAPFYREQCKQQLASLDTGQSWAELQQQFLSLIDRYIDVEIGKPIEANIHNHEAGGQFRIAFPHQTVRGDERLRAHLKRIMEARKAWTDRQYYHGIDDCCEVHHEIETFIYFQIPLFYWQLPGMDVALQSIEDVAHHTGNWEPDVPAWYDWQKHEFVSCWIGTRSVRDYAPYNYQEANHFRYMDAVMAAYQGTGAKRYLELMHDYARRWCDHIEELDAQGKPIQCSIVPRKAATTDLEYSGERKAKSTEYQVFYSFVSDNTAYDVTGHLLDLYRVTGVERYLHAAQRMMEQFWVNHINGRPAQMYSDGKWHVVGHSEKLQSFVTDCTYLARLALRHDMITGTMTYRQRVLNWAAQIDEQQNVHDQMMSNVLVAAHFYDGNPDWLTRAYAMALRTAAVVESEDRYNQCLWGTNRQGTKFLMEMLYQPLLGGVEWGTRGNMPILLLKHRNGDREGLPEGISFRIWRTAAKEFQFEAVNTSDTTQTWQLVSQTGETLYIKETLSDCIQVDALATVRGQLVVC